VTASLGADQLGGRRGGTALANAVVLPFGLQQERAAMEGREGRAVADRDDGGAREALLQQPVERSLGGVVRHGRRPRAESGRGGRGGGGASGWWGAGEGVRFQGASSGSGGARLASPTAARASPTSVSAKRFGRAG